MSQGQILDVLREGMMLAFKMCAPLLIISIVVGLIVAIFQAATQIHEQTLTFVPKLVVVALLLLFSGSWMMEMMGGYMQKLFAIIQSIP